MSYSIEYEKIDTFRENLVSAMKAHSDRLEQVSSVIRVIVDSDAIEGATADRMRNYMGDVHLSALSLFHNVFQVILMDILKYQVGYAQNVDDSNNARFSSDEFTKIKSDINSLKNRTEYIDSSIKQILQSVASIYAPNEVGGYPGTNNIMSLYDTITAGIDSLDQAIQFMENGYVNSALSEIDSILDLLEAYITSNRGHNSVYISSYTTASRGALYRAVNQYHQAIDRYVEENRGQYSDMVAFVTQRTYERNQNIIDAELDAQLEKGASQIKFYGFVGDCCIKLAELAFIAFGAPKPVVDLVGGTVDGGWKGSYSDYAEQLQNYKRGDGALIDEAKHSQSVVVGTVKGGVSSLITIGTGEIFDGIGELPVVESLTKADNPIVKFGSNVVLDTIEDRTSDVITNVTNRYIDTTAQQITEGSAYQGKSALEAAFDRDSITEDITDTGEWVKSATKSTVSEVFDSVHEGWNSDIESPDQLLKTHGGKRVIAAGFRKASETFTSEVIGVGLESVVTTTGVDRYEDSKQAMKELFTDDAKRQALIHKSVSSGITGSAKDAIEQDHESEIIQYNLDRRRQQRATEAMGLEEPIAVDKYGNPDYGKTNVIYKDKETGTKATVSVRLEKGDKYETIVSRAEEEYSIKLGIREFTTPDDYRWVLKYDKASGSDKVTLQLVQGSKIPSQVFD